MKWKLTLAGCAFCISSVFAQLTINEFDYDQPGSDNAEFVELYNAGIEPINLENVQLIFMNGSNDAMYDSVHLPKYNLSPHEFYLICFDNAFPKCNMLRTDISLQNGPDGILLIQDADTVDRVSYEGDMPNVTEGSRTVGDYSSALSLGRYPDGFDSDNNRSDFYLRCVSPGYSNIMPPVAKLIEDTLIRLAKGAGFQLTPEDINLDSYDVCGTLDEIRLGKNYFDSTDVGTHFVNVYLTDNEGNTSADSFRLTVLPFAEFISGTCSDTSQNGIRIHTLENSSVNYSLDGIHYSSSISFSNLSPQWYNLRMKDSFGEYDLGSYEVLPTTFLDIDVQQTGQLTKDETNSLWVQVAINQGTAPFQYNFGEGWSLNSSYKIQQPGNYLVEVQDAAGCMVTQEVSVDIPKIKSRVYEDIKCFGGYGKIILKSDDTSFQYSIDGQNYQPTGIFYGLAKGQHVIYAKGKSIVWPIDTITITEPEELSFVAARTNDICEEVAIVEVQIQGGQAPYDIKWNNGGFDVKAAAFIDTMYISGLHQLKVRDANECETYDYLNIELAKNLQLEAETFGPNCIDSRDGYCIAYPKGGKQPYLFSLNGGYKQSNPMFVNLDTGIYHLEMTDVRGCQQKASLSISYDYNPIQISLDVNITNPLMEDVSVEGGMPPYAYGLFDRNFGFIEKSMDYEIDGAIVAVRDASLCMDTLHVPKRVGLEKTIMDAFEVYPNPSSGMFRIDGLLGTETIRITNALGQVILQLKNTNEIDLSPFEEGIYIMMIHRSDGNVLTRKLIRE